MMLSRSKPSSRSHHRDRKKKKKKVPVLEDLIRARDYTGAIALLEFEEQMQEATGKKSKGKLSKEDVDRQLWIAFAAFHLGDHHRAGEVYRALLDNSKEVDLEWHSFLACCLFYQGLSQEAMEEVVKGPTTNLQNRLLFHLAHKNGDEEKLMQYHQKLQMDSVEDQLCLASVHCLRSHFQEAIDVYKRLLMENRDWHAINAYIAMCYYKLDYNDVSHEMLSAYLQNHPSSPTAINLKACNHFRLYNGQTAEAELKPLRGKGSSERLSEFIRDLVEHNSVVFRAGEGALKVFPPLVGVIPEARLNLVVHYLHNDQVQEAYDTLKDSEPTSPPEYILRGVVEAAYGQMPNIPNGRDHLRLAQQYFQVIGASPTECDTISGRESMASTFYLLAQWHDSLLYLNSIKEYLADSDEFAFNFGVANGSVGEWQTAEDSFASLHGDKLRNDFTYLSWMMRCYIMNEKPRLAWELYEQHSMDPRAANLLTLVAHDCYRQGHFFYAAKAFDTLEKQDPQNPEIWEGKVGACAGCFQMIVANVEPKALLPEILRFLQESPNEQAGMVEQVMRQWGEENGVQGLDGNGMGGGDPVDDDSATRLLRRQAHQVVHDGVEDAMAHDETMEAERERQRREMKEKIRRKKAHRKREKERRKAEAAAAAAEQGEEQ